MGPAFPPYSRQCGHRDHLAWYRGSLRGLGQPRACWKGSATQWPQLGWWPQPGFAGLTGHKAPASTSAQQQRHTSASVWPGAPGRRWAGRADIRGQLPSARAPGTKPSVPLRCLCWATAGRAPAGEEGLCKLAGPAPTRPPSHQARGHVHAVAALGTRQWSFRRGGRVVYKAPKRLPVASQLLLLSSPAPGCPGLLPATTCRGVRGAVLTGGHGKGLPLAADPEGILTGAWPSLGWSKTSHHQRPPEGYDGWSAPRSPSTPRTRRRRAEWAPGKLVTWVLTWPTTPRCTLRGSGPWGCGRVFQVPCLPSVSSHSAWPRERTPAHSALQGELLSLRVRLHPSM